MEKENQEKWTNPGSPAILPLNRRWWQYTLCLKKRPTFDLLKLWHTRSHNDNYWQKCYWGSKKSDNALFSHLTYLVLQHYLAKVEAKKTAHWCTMCATQYNCCSAVNFLSPEPCPPTASSWTHWLQDLGSHTTAWVWAMSQKRFKEINSDWLNSGNALQPLSEKCNFCAFSRFARYCRSTSYLRWRHSVF